MANYHPIDVRYKGPSTAYTGSANKRQLDTPKVQPDRQPAKVRQQTKATPPAGPNPWGIKQAGSPNPAPRPQPKPRPEPRAQMPLAMRLLLPWPVQFVTGMFRRLGWAWSIALIYLLGTVLF